MFFLLMVTIAAALLFFIANTKRTRESDINIINEYAKSINSKVISLTRSDKYWAYWLRGRLDLSNMAKIFIVVLEGPDRTEMEVHLAVDPFSLGEKLKVLRNGPKN